MKIGALESALRRDLDPRMQALSNGPAGENLLPGRASRPTRRTRPAAAAAAP